MPGARGRLLREREFGLLFAGSAVSAAGDRLVLVAMPFAVLSIPGAGLADVGIVLGASTLALAAFVLVGGVWADNTALVAGPAVAGLLVATTSPAVAIAADAATFAVSAVALALLRPRPGAVAPRATLAADLREGLREVTGRTWLWSVLLAFSAYHALVLPALFVLGPGYAEQARGGAAAWGLISAGFGVGAVAGGLLATRWHPARPGPLLLGGLGLGATQSALVVSPLPTLAVAGAEAVAGAGMALCFALWDTALQRAVPEHAQSRVSSFDFLASLTLMPVGYLAVGPVADALGDRPTALLASAVSLAVTGAVICSPSVRQMAYSHSP